jgi:hypothetical protein
MFRIVAAGVTALFLCISTRLRADPFWWGALKRSRLGQVDGFAD